jgi:hypothetical protein
MSSTSLSSAMDQNFLGDPLYSDRPLRQRVSGGAHCFFDLVIADTIRR